jgi:indolepyruvate ferredoxin oxidoreductase
MLNVTPDLSAISLDDKYEKSSGRVFITGTQALLRLLLIQKEIDERAQLNTRGYVSGYRGSPLGTLDSVLWKEKRRIGAAGVVFKPGVNEDLAATSVWGTQQVAFFPEPQVDGVYAMWYGKAPGVDRSADVLRHGNTAGAAPNGGVLLAVGDDHPGKSSTVVNQSEPLLAALNIPVLYPANVQEIIEYGLMGWALSRYSGLWVGLKLINETVEQTQTVNLDVANFSPVLPDRGLPASEINLSSPQFNPQLADIKVQRVRMPLVGKFVKANGLDKEIIGGKGGLGIVTAGKSYNDTMQALDLLGISQDRARELGLSIYKVGCIWPLETTGFIDFSKDHSALLFVEEKLATIENQAVRALANSSIRPLILGKIDAEGAPLIPADIQLDPAFVATTIAKLLHKLGAIDAAAYSAMIAPVQALQPAAPSNLGVGGAIRTPFFCSGCPHNTSTRLPEGSLAMAGIGCHGMAILSRKDTLPPTHMGGEGMNWAGAALFSGTKHMFQNLGDGTYYHSGLLAIRAAVAAGVNITYKILYNDAVAMTGGQPVDGPISVPDIIGQVSAEGVKKVVVVSDNPDAYRGQPTIPGDVEIYHRDDLNAVQKKMREIEGTSVLIYEQTCAAEKRRRRKRGSFPNPPKRMFINTDVCEGCGDCSVQSTCVSIQPVETELGTKRRIDQSSCNKDYSCVKGFCPSFVTVLDAEPKKPSAKTLSEDLFADIPIPLPAKSSHSETGIMIAGVGGTGVTTVGAVLGMAAHIDGKVCSIYDMTGVAQKNGAVYSHLKIGNQPSDIATQRIGIGQADVVLGFDLIAALGGDSAIVYNDKRTRFVGNAEVVPTSGFQFNRDLDVNQPALVQRVKDRIGANNAHFIGASRLALRLLGDTIGANMFIVGYALQIGCLPVSLASVRKAIELNGAALKFNLTALELGRLYAHDPVRVTNMLQTEAPKGPQSLDMVIAARIQHLTEYQNADYAARFSGFVERVRAIEAAKCGGSTELTLAVARNLSKLMAYKDEYEVARLYASPAFLQRLETEFEPGYKLKFNLAPPILSRRDPETGHLKKREFGGWLLPAFGILAKMKGLRGTPADIFGYTAERKMERALIGEYQAAIESVLASLDPETLPQALIVANKPDQIRGFGHVKEKAVANAWGPLRSK